MADRPRIDQRTRAIIIIGGVVVALAAVLFVVLRGGGGTEQTLPSLPGGTTPVLPAPGVSASPSAAPQTFQVFEGKDPFQPLVEASQSPAPGGTSTPSPGATGGPTTGQRIRLLDVFSQSGVMYASVDVNGQTFTVKPGDTFAGSYRLVSLQDRCGTFVFGDERFTLCIGQEVLK